MASTTTTTIRTQATRPLYATVGLTDKAVEVIRDSVSRGQQRVADIREDAQRIAELRRTPEAVPQRVQELLEEHDLAYDQLVDRGESLVGRVRRQQSTKDATKAARTTKAKAKTTITQGHKAAEDVTDEVESAARSTARTARSRAEATVEDAKATARKTSRETKSTAKKTADNAKKQASRPRSSAKATGTSARKTASSTAKAVKDAAAKVGD